MLENALVILLLLCVLCFSIAAVSGSTILMGLGFFWLVAAFTMEYLRIRRLRKRK